MKFKVEIEVEILDEELVDLINSTRGWDDEKEELYTYIEEIPESEIMEWCENDEGYFQEDIKDYGFDISKITLIKE